MEPAAASRLRTLDEDRERHASWPELFFDVVFVVAIAQLAHELAVDHFLRGFAVFAALFLPVFIAWQGFTIYDRFDTDDTVFRVAIFAAMLAIAALAVQVPDVAHGESTGFVVAYAVLRSLMVALYLRSYRHVPPARPLIARYAAGYSFGISLWLLSSPSTPRSDTPSGGSRRVGVQPPGPLPPLPQRHPGQYEPRPRALRPVHDHRLRRDDRGGRACNWQSGLGAGGRGRRRARLRRSRRSCGGSTSAPALEWRRGRR